MSRSPRQSSAGQSAGAVQPPAAALEPGLTFEKALAELELIVARMEDGEASLELALAAHKRGLDLARYCQERLDAARAQVKVLEGDVLKNLSTLQSDADGDVA